MSEIIDFIVKFIRIDIFVGFGFYSIIYFLLLLYLKDKTLIIEFDKSAVQLIIFGGIVWFVLWLIGTLIFYLELDGIEKSEYYEQLIGKYSYGTWIQPIFWLILTQLYRINFIKRFLFFRLAISLLFVLTFERFVIIVTSLHRDYLPSNWTLKTDLELSAEYWILGLLAKVLIFIATASIFHFGRKKIKTLYNKT